MAFSNRLLRMFGLSSAIERHFFFPVNHCVNRAPPSDGIPHVVVRQDQALKRLTWLEKRALACYLKTHLLGVAKANIYLEVTRKLELEQQARKVAMIGHKPKDTKIEHEESGEGKNDS